MDDIKLNLWQERFETESKRVREQFSTFFSKHEFSDCCRLVLNESHEWELELSKEMPSDIQSHLQETLLTTKPEDSI